MRKEWKFILSADEVGAIFSFLKSVKATVDENSGINQSYSIKSVYLLVWNNIYSHGKIRLRVYKNNNQNTYFIENKYKQGKYSFKIRIPIEEDQYEKLCTTSKDELISIISHLYPQIINFDMNDFLLSIDYKRIIVEYMRKAYSLIFEDENLRITIDSQIFFIFDKDDKISLLPSDKQLLEIKGLNVSKFVRTYLPWLSKNKIKYSKYRKSTDVLNNERR